MGCFKVNFSILAAVVLSAMWIALPAQATLGEKFESTYQLKLAPTSGYSTHENKSDSSTVKEFADKNGVVFAVTWSGSHHPDLKKLFGKHFTHYKAALAQSPRGHGRAPVEVKNDDIVVRVGGHMGAVHGFAYVPSLVPEGVSVEDLK